MPCVRRAADLPRHGRTFPEFPEEGCIPRGFPVLAGPVPAGAPRPAAGFAEERLSLDAHLAAPREATFLVRVIGGSMTDFAIHDGDLLVVDRDAEVADRSIVVAVVDGRFTVKQLCRIPQGILLRSGGDGQGDILVSADQELAIWGVVTWVVHRLPGTAWRERQECGIRVDANRQALQGSSPGASGSTVS